MVKQAEVMFIDGDPILHRILQYHFLIYDIHLIICRNGLETLELINSDKEWDALLLIILERNLQDIDGLELIRKINQKFKKKVPIIFLTEYGTNLAIIEGLREGAIEYVTKPFNLEIFIEKIRAIVTWQKERMDARISGHNHFDD